MKEYTFVPVLLLSIFLFIFTCSLPVDPINPANSNVTLSLNQNANAVYASDTTKFKAVFTLRQYIDSLIVILDTDTLHFHKTDSVMKSDTLHFSYVFKSEGYRQIKSEVYISNNTSVHPGVVQVNVQPTKISKLTTLKSISISNVKLTPVFYSDTLNYTGTVDSKSDTINILPIATDTNETIKINGLLVKSGDSTTALPLLVGKNKIVVSVRSADQTLTRDYVLNITRQASTISTLQSLTLIRDSFKHYISPDSLPYTDSVSLTTDSIAFKPVLTDTQARVSINGILGKSAETFTVNALPLGDNKIKIDVIAQDTTVKTSYYVDIYRSKEHIFSSTSIDTVQYKSSILISLPKMATPILIVDSSFSFGWYTLSKLNSIQANALLRFDNVTPWIKSQKVLSAVIRLTKTDTMAHCVNIVSANSSNYNPQSISWTTKPGLVTGYADSSSTPDSSGKTWEIDVTNIVQAWADNKFGNYGFSISQEKPSSSGIFQSYIISSLFASKLPSLTIRLK